MNLFNKPRRYWHIFFVCLSVTSLILGFVFIYFNKSVATAISGITSFISSILAVTIFLPNDT